MKKPEISNPSKVIIIPRPPKTSTPTDTTAGTEEPTGTAGQEPEESKETSAEEAEPEK